MSGQQGDHDRMRSHATDENQLDFQVLGAKGPRLVALHGIQGTNASWLPVAERLSTDCTVILPNLRGRGHAKRGAVASDYTLDAFASDLLAIINRSVGEAPFFLAGWSMGVSVILAYLQGAGPRPRGLILASGSPWLGGTRWFSRDDSALMSDIAERERRLGLRTSADRDAVAMTWTAISATDQRSGLNRIRLPTVILHGAMDEDCPVDHAMTLSKGISGAGLVTYPGSGHALLAQRPAEVAQQILDFIANHSRESDLR